MAITQLKVNNKFTNIIQVSDIHIRLTKRHDEYKEVFKKLYNDVSLTPLTTAIFITGDVVNSKIDLSPECVDLAAELFFNLAELRPTILIAGNHDTNLSNRHRLDSLSPIVSALNHPNLFYLKESGLYGFCNICINNYGVFDSPEKYIKGEDIPKIYRNQYKYFIALYHGTVDGATTDLGFSLTNPSIKVSTFDNHDIVLLGDIHKAQDLQIYDDACSKPAIRYCGSLIQQKHDEPLNGHGYSYWNLERREYSHIETPNDYGFYSVLIDNGVIISNLKNLPKKSRIRFQLKNTLPTDVKKALIAVKEFTEVIESSYQKLDTDIALTRIPTSTGNAVLGNINDRTYQIKLLEEFIKNKFKITDENFIQEIIKINNSMNDLIKKDDFARNIRWLPIKFEWENMFSYGENNVIDFTKLKDLIGLFASNTSGKSSVFSALTFCIFDKCEREYKAVNIMNTKKTTFKCKFEFEIDGKRYFIQREAKADKKGKVKVEVRFWIIENGQERDLNGEQRKDTNEIIREYLGSYEDFVLTTLSVQNGKNNVSVIDMGDTDRKDLFAQFMGLNVFDRLYNEANEELKSKIVALKNYKNDDYTQKLITSTNFLSQLESQFNDENNIISKISKEMADLQNEILHETKKFHKLDVEIPQIKISEINKEKIEIKIKNRNEEIENIKKDETLILKKLSKLEPEILDLEKSDIAKNRKIYQNLLTEKNNIEAKLDTIKLSYEHNKLILDKSNSIKYDPNCTFCVKNAGTAIVDGNNAQKKIEQLREDGIKIKEQFNDIKNKIKEMSWLVEADIKYHSIITERDLLKDQQIQITCKIHNSNNNLTEYKEELRINQNNIDLYNKNVESMKTNELVNNKILEHKKKLFNIEFDFKNKNKNILEINGRLSVCKNQILEINKNIDNIKIIEKEHQLYEIYCQAVSRDGIPFDIITATVPEIQNEVNNTLSHIADFTALFETDGKNIIPYIVYDDKKWLMSLTSGFEKFALSLAIRVSLINISNLPRPNFLIIDEGFGVLDPENLTHMEALFDYLKSNFDFIIIISHLESLRDVVDKHIEIIKENGFSRIEYR